MIARSEFATLQVLLRDTAGIVLEDDKAYLVDVRLGPLARRLGIGSAADLVVMVSDPSAHELRRLTVEAMANSETLFFRDYPMFEMLRNRVIPTLAAARGHGGRLRVWSAACSTGQEPYSLAMLLDGLTLSTDTKVELIATDLCRENIARGRSGTYSQFEVNRGLPAPMLVRHFAKVGEEWRISEAMRSAVEFRELNLVRMPPLAGLFDLILLRNVMIYWDGPTRRAVLDGIRSALRPDGALVLGAAENTHGIHEGFARVSHEGASYYRVV